LSVRPLDELAKDLQDCHFVEAAHFLRADFSSLEDMRRHVLFWDLPKCANFLDYLGESVHVLDHAHATDLDQLILMAAESLEIVSSLAAKPSDLDWSSLSSIFVRRLGFMVKKGAAFNGRMPGGYLKHRGSESKCVQHRNAFKDVVELPNFNTVMDHKFDQCKKDCNKFCSDKCANEWPFSALLAQIRNAIVHSVSWNTQCKDIAELKSLLDVTDTGAITPESIVRFLLAPRDNLEPNTYLERGYLVLLCFVIVENIKRSNHLGLKASFQSVIQSHF
jgi:hypothetical protein